MADGKYLKGTIISIPKNNNYGMIRLDYNNYHGKILLYKQKGKRNSEKQEVYFQVDKKGDMMFAVNLRNSVPKQDILSSEDYLKSIYNKIKIDEHDFLVADHSIIDTIPGAHDVWHIKKIGNTTLTVGGVDYYLIGLFENSLSSIPTDSFYMLKIEFDAFGPIAILDLNLDITDPLNDDCEPFQGGKKCRITPHSHFPFN